VRATIAAGIGLTDYPFRTASGFWRWVDLCEQGGVDSIWQSDRLISRTSVLECMTALAAVAGRTRRIKSGSTSSPVAMRESGAAGQAMRPPIDVLVRRPHAARLRHRQPAGVGMGCHEPRPGDARRKTDEALEIISRLWEGRES